MSIAVKTAPRLLHSAVRYSASLDTKHNDVTLADSRHRYTSAQSSVCSLNSSKSVVHVSALYISV